jgi:hypothetical protein
MGVDEASIQDVLPASKNALQLLIVVAQLACFDHETLRLIFLKISDRIVASIPACHAGDLGSIPSQRV